jgi:carbon-monoxide dehydrogenase medium subunit
MKPARFGYRRAHDLIDAIALLQGLGDDAKIIAGGQSLVAMMNFRLSRPSHLIDISGLGELRGIERVGPTLHIGALTTHHAVETSIDPAFDVDFAIIRDAMRWIGHLPIRTRGTAGGSLAHADATAEWCLLAVLLEAQIVAIGPTGERQIEASEFFAGFYTTVLAPDEIITKVVFPASAARSALTEHADRHGDFATVAAAVQLEFDTDGKTVQDGRVALAGVAPTPIRIAEAETLLLGGHSVDEDLFEAVSDAVVAAIDPPSDGNGSAAYRKSVTRTLVHRACRAAARTDARTSRGAG